MSLPTRTVGELGSAYSGCSATSTGIYDRVRANLPADKMRAFNLLARNAAKLGGKLSKLAEMCPDRVQVRKEGGGRRNVYTIAHSVTG